MARDPRAASERPSGTPSTRWIWELANQLMHATSQPTGDTTVVQQGKSCGAAAAGDPPSVLGKSAFSAWQPGKRSTGKRKHQQTEGGLLGSEPPTPNPSLHWCRQLPGEWQLQLQQEQYLEDPMQRQASTAVMQSSPSTARSPQYVMLTSQQQQQALQHLQQLPGEVSQAVAVYCAFYELKRQGSCSGLELPMPILSTLVSYFARLPAFRG